MVVAAGSHPDGPGQLWVADLAVGRTDAGFLYVAAVLDCYSRRCMGFATAPELGPELVIRAVEMAAEARSQSGESTRFSVPLALSERCATAELRVPYGASPSALDAAVATSFFSLLGRELLDSGSWRTRTDAAEAISSWIQGSYNRLRVAHPGG